MLSAFLSVAAASEVCESAPEMGIDQRDCEAIHEEFLNMVDSGKSISELETDLIQCYGIIQEGCQRLPTKVMPAEIEKQKNGGSSDSWPSCKQLCAEGCNGNSCGNCRCGNEWVDGCSVGNPAACGHRHCMKANFSRYLHCVGRRVSKCYRQKWTTTRECENAAPTEWGGCTQEWDQKYNCCSSHQNHGSMGCDSSC